MSRSDVQQPAIEPGLLGFGARRSARRGQAIPVDVGPVTTPQEISKIAYGFMASKALFVALHLDVFSHLHAGRSSLQTLAEATGATPVEHLRTLMAALEAVGLVTGAELGPRLVTAPSVGSDLVQRIFRTIDT